MKDLGQTLKVGVVGTGMVGSSFAYALLQSRIAGELVLVDLDRDRAEGEAMDLSHGLPFARPMDIRAGDFQDLAGCRVAVITAGRNQKPGESRIDLVRQNAAIMREIVPQIALANPGGVILMATNPVDVLTEVAAECAQLSSGQVLGSGTVLDTARFRYLIGDHFEINPRSVHAYVIGEHGDTQVPVWSQASVGGVRLSEFPCANGRRLDRATKDHLAQLTRDAAYQVIKRKKATYYAIGLGLVAVVEAILRDLKSVLTVCSPMNGPLGLHGVSLSLPTIVGEAGAERVLELPLESEEREALQKSANFLQEQRQALDQI